MNLPQLIIAGVVILIVAAVIIYTYLRHKREAPIRAWLEAATAASRSVDYPRVGPPPSGYEIIPDAAREFRQIQATAEAFDAIRAAGDEKTQFDLMLKLRSPRRLQSVDDINWFYGRLRELTQQHVAQLLKEARAESQAAMAELISFTKRGGTYKMCMGEDFETPSDWDELVAILFENPSWEDFRLYNPDPAPNEVRLMAAKALRTRNLRDAKLLLAFCSANPNRSSRYKMVSRYHDEAIKRQSELADLVVEIHAEWRLFQTQSAPTTRP